MSDNFGTSQSRVLTVDDRSLDQVVFQDRRVPLSSEWNLINQIGDFKTSEAVKVNQPSGWVRVGEVRDSGATTTGESISNFEYSAKSGDLLTSLTYNPLRVKFACRETTNVAVVNGWPIIVQNPPSHPLVPAGENDVDTFIELTLPSGTGSYRYDIVFLEVWRKLVGADDPIYPYGNVDASPFSDNQILWNVIGAETSKRVQIQYRIRTFPSESYGNLLDPTLYPSGLGWSNVRPIGGNTAGSYVMTSGYHFKNAGHRDTGLYIAGDGSSAAQTLLNTVDGYVYAIPMFLVYRRAAGVTYGPNNVHGASVTRNDFVSGKVSDRPDGKLSNVIVADDIIDVRHQLVTSGKELDAIVQDSFRKLIRGGLKTTAGQGYTTNNQKLVCTGGSECIKTEQLNGSSSTLPNIGDGITSGLMRRLYSKAGATQNHNIVEVPINGAVWAAGTINVSTFLSTTLGAVSPTGISFYSDDTWTELTGVTGTPTTVTIAAGSNLEGTTWKLYMEFSYEYESGSDGFYDVPKEFLEVGKYVYQPIAVRDRDLPVRYDNNQQLLTSASEDYLSYQGGNYTESYDFGHDYIYHTTESSSTFNVSAVGGKVNGYTIHGIKRVQIKSGGTWTLAETFGVDRNISGSDISFAITITSTIITTATEIRVTLITGSGSTETESMKFFELSKQGRGVVDIYETIEVLATPDNPTDLANGIYTIDTLDKPIIAVHGHAALATGDHLRGVPFAFEVNGASETRVGIKITPPGGGTPTAEINQYLPILDSSQYEDNMQPTRIKVEHAGSAPYPNQLRVAVLVHSYVPASESAYHFYYRFVPYQGLLASTEERGRIEKEGPAIVTSEGSGTIKNFTYSNGTVNTTQDNRTVVKVSGTSWKYSVEPGDYFVVSGSDYMYRIKYVGIDATGTQADTRITLAEPFVEASLSGTAFSIIRLDIPNSNLSNIIDRMPTYAQEDYKGRSEDMALGNVAGTVIDVTTKARLQDPMDSMANDFQIGLSKESGSRGRNHFVLTDGNNSFFKLGELTPYIKYGVLGSWTADKGNKKVFQAYLFNKSYKDNIGRYRDLTGRMYLLVVSSETGLSGTEILLNPYSVSDAVDIFELVGRPVIRTS